MNKNTDHTETLRKYLLGELPEKYLEEVEDGWMTQEEGLLHLRLAEEELIDDYVRGELSTGETQRFEEYFLTSEGRRSQLAFSRALKRWIDAQPKPETDTLWRRFRAWLAGMLPKAPEWVEAVPALALTLALLLVGTGGVLSTVAWWQVRGQLDSSFAVQASLEMDRRDLRSRLAGNLVQFTQDLQEARQENLSLTDQLARVRSESPPSIVHTELLQAGDVLRGGGDLTRVSFPARIDYVELQLELGIDDARAYRAVLSSEDGEVLTWHALKAEQVRGSPVAVVSVPARFLPAGHYIVALSGVLDDGREEFRDRYSFQVVR